MGVFLRPTCSSFGVLLRPILGAFLRPGVLVVRLFELIRPKKTDFLQLPLVFRRGREIAREVGRGRMREKLRVRWVQYWKSRIFPNEKIYS